MMILNSKSLIDDFDRIDFQYQIDDVFFLENFDRFLLVIRARKNRMMQSYVCLLYTSPSPRD